MQRKGFTIFLLLFFPVLVFGQGLKIKGKVTDNNGEPLLGANVMIAELSLGAATDIDGNYVFEVPSANVNGQEVVLTASYIGFKQKRSSIVLRGNTLEVNFVLEEDIFKSEEIVVTGIASRTSKAVADVAVARVDASDLTAKQLYQGVNQLLAGKVAGVQLKQASGTVGSGFRFFVRGGGGLNGSQQPVIYLDGVRISSSTVEGFASGGQDMSLLANLNPSDIESLEVLKGPAATATYGTNGANGVVIIKTKQGQISKEGSFNVNYKFNYGFNEQSFKYKNDIFENDSLINTFFKKGPIREHSLSMNGGNATLRYYTSFQRREESGIMENNSQVRNSFRFNLTALPSEKVQLSVSSSYVDNVINTINNDNSLLSLLGQALSYKPAWPNASRKAIEAMRNVNKNNQFIGSMNILYRPIENLEINGTFGIDQTDWSQVKTQPFGYLYFNDSKGTRSLFSFNQRLINSSLNATYSYQLFKDLSVKSAVGVQLGDTRYKSTAVSYKKFSTDALNTIGAGSEEASKGETLLHERDAGIYTDHQFNYRNTYIFSVALRKDYASTIGDDAPSIFYPKFSGAVRLDKFDIFPSFVNMFKLRTSYGEGGILPRSTDGIPLLYGGAKGPDGSHVFISSTGNAKIKPERLKEFETGLDIELFNKLSVEMTYYYQTAKSSIVNKTNSSSSGLGAFSTPVNLGAVKNYGFESQIKYNPIRTIDYSLDFSLIWNYQNNEVTDLGGTGDIWDGSRINVIKKGLSKHEFYAEPVLGARYDEKTGKYLGPKVGKKKVALGNPIPDHTGSLSINFRFLKNFNFYAFLEWGLNNKVFNFTKRWLAPDGGSTKYNNLKKRFTELSKKKDYSNPEYKSVTGQLARLDYRYKANFIEDADYLVLRELSLSYDCTDLFKELNNNNVIKNMVLGFSVRNVFRTSKYTFGDFEVNSSGGRGLSRGQDFYTLQNPRTYNFWLKLGF